MLYEPVRLMAVAVMRLLFRLRAEGRHHVPLTGPVLLVANHSSLVDPPAIGGLTPRPVSFLAKAELFGVPFLGWLIRHLNARPLRRGGADPSALRLALRVLQEQGALLVFPEGTRGEEGVLRPPKAGAGMLAVLSGAPVVPVYIAGSGRAWPRGRRLPRPGRRITVFFGAPVRFERQDDRYRKKEAYEAASAEMMSAIARLRDTAASRGGMVVSPGTDRTAGGVGVGGPQASPKYTQERNVQQ
jgi:1-acyl-sn-glycerol-3-phosphate acyltransferase